MFRLERVHGIVWDFELDEIFKGNTWLNAKIQLAKNLPVENGPRFGANVGALSVCRHFITHEAERQRLDGQVSTLRQVDLLPVAGI